MKKSTLLIFDSLFLRYPSIKVCKDDIASSLNVLIASFQSGGKLLVCGNGGSAADSIHIVGELMKGFCKPRKISVAFKNELETKYGEEDAAYYEKNLEKGLPCLSLVDEAALNSAYINDKCADLVFANQILALGKSNDVLLAISTSGNSKNVVQAIKIANVLSLKTILLSGNDGGIAKNYATISIVVPEKETYKIQEKHLPIYHALCLALENEFFG